MLTGRRNIDVDVVGTNKSDITRITDAIHGLGVKVDSSEMMRKRHIQPFNHFSYKGQKRWTRVLPTRTKTTNPCPSEGASVSVIRIFLPYIPVINTKLLLYPYYFLYILWNDEPLNNYSQ
jgi:hypothetical protein